jgi:3-isopropylmalate dehydrogenase
MMLDWLGERLRIDALGDAAMAIDRAVDAVFSDGRVRPFEFGGRDGTREISDAIASHL